MIDYNDPLRLAEEIQGTQVNDSASTTAIPLHMIDGYSCLQAFGDDLSLEDAPLVEMDDFVLS